MTKSASPIQGIIPVMLTPFKDDGQIDYPGLENLIEWYLAHGADALFAVCQSSEMMFLSLEERLQLGRFVVGKVKGRVPVVVSGHISDDVDKQVEELAAMSEVGADALILVTNHLDPKNTGTETFMATLKVLLERLPKDMPLGLYECPAPYRRLITDEELKWCAESGRFIMLKDVSCDLPTVKRRLALTANTPLRILNANAAIAWDAMQAGAPGFNGVFANIHPDLYKWLLVAGAKHPDLARELANFLVLAAVAETQGYPAFAKLYHQRIGTFGSIRCRVINYDIREKFWALDVILDKLIDGTEHYRAKIAKLPA
ncbi:dihydrodipicolinate synthase family protein [Uliginosibacterium gangwonense]|uniref:dihydrodipicolinate synthase family protein n=1 Tax=Uliginosibacterium gangwonense TaxID=392736 RepID=UPI00035FF0A0|nr:dihydrodipicolinate synthase family protein [Uliginosibacterium gangwonense]